MKVYVVLCRVDGCEECGTEVHIVAIRSKREEAYNVMKAHSWEPGAGDIYPHLHPNYVSIVEVEIDGPVLAGSQV
jgi:hypothetical protein